MEHYDPFFGWEPGTTVIMPGQGAMLFNPSTDFFQVEIFGLPPYPRRSLSLQRNVPALVGRQSPGTATFKDIMGSTPQNGTRARRELHGQQMEYAFINGAWQPEEPVAEVGEAMWITLACLYLANPSNMVVEAVSPQGAPVQYPVNASSYCGGQVTVNCAPPPGSMLPLGMHVVTCQASDGLGNYSSCNFTVEVVDTTAPSLHGASDISVECNSPLGATVVYHVTASDLADPAPQLVCSPPSGSTFPLGMTLVRCTAWDARGNTNESIFTVTVADTQAPQIICPANVSVLKTQPDGAELPFQVQFSDLGDMNLMVEYSTPPGGVFPLGTTTVTCAVTDASGNANTCSFDVTVIQPDPGQISGLNAAPESVSLSIPTQAGVEYEVEYKNSLDEPNWQPLGVMIGDGNVMSFHDPNPAELMRFYRVRAP